MTVMNRNLNLILICWAQLPPGLHDKVAIDVHTDPYGLRPTVVVVDKSGRKWMALLEPMVMEGVEVNAKLPDTFVAELCAVV